MEDDIDIEEHDPLDNPRIKSIFADLSIVKIEQLEDVEGEDTEMVENEEYYQEEQEEQEDQQTKDYRPQEMLYTYEYSFETTSENVSQETEYEEYYHSNKIILGSKPPTDPKVLYEEALNSITVVCLENWGERLNTSPCYCHDCQILFPTINALDAHKMTSHSYLVALDTQRNTARKSTVTSKYCNHCFKTFPDDTSLIKHLYELLPMNNFPKTPEKEEITQFKCQKCKMIFNDYAASKWHKKNAHPNLSHVNNLIVKVQKNKVKLKEKSAKVEENNIKKSKRIEDKREGKIFADASLVPKNTLFQCNICHINFMSCFGAFKHSKVCKKETAFKKCGICERKIKDKDQLLHKLQHEYSEKIKIYTVYKSIYEKVLFKCPKCVACFDELLFWAHYKDCNNAGSSYCPDCGLNIATARYQGHRLKHKEKKYTKKDFIIVEFHDKSQPESKIINVTKPKLKRKIDRTEVTLYYCDFCGCCQYMLAIKGHTHGYCKKTISKQFCDRCGLCISAGSKKNHDRLHQRRTFTRKNCKFYSLLTGQEVTPPAPNMYLCKKCGKHFLSQRKAKYHDCEEKSVTCKICTKKFNLQAYKIHRHYHLDTDMIPELLKKYKSIKQLIWNILYKCMTCDLIFVNYDSVISHAQNHFNSIAEAVKHCSICNFRVLKNDFKDHENLHMNNQAVKRSSFKILDFNFNDLLKDNWMVPFQELPKQILSKSIYKHTRRIKMKIHSGPSDEVKYFCVNCKTYIEGNSLEKHVRTSCQPSNKYVCITCNEVFKSLQTFLRHEGSHEKLQKKGVVLFNDPADRSFNDKLMFKEKVNLKDKKRYNIYKCIKCNVCVFLKHSVQRHGCGKKRFCVTCYQFYSSKAFNYHLILHKKKPNVNLNTLNVILFNEDKVILDNFLEKEKVEKEKSFEKDEEDTSFSKEEDTNDKSFEKEENDKSFSKEEDTNDKSFEKEENDKSFSKEEDTNDKSFEKEENDKSFSKEKDKNKSLNEEEEGSYWILLIKNQKPASARIFKCDCGLHFTSLNVLQEHLDICEQDIEVSKEKCSKCGLIFPTDILVSHLIKHHSKETKIDVETIKKIQFYKCIKCSLIFTSTQSYELHLSNCNNENGRKCSYCHLKFNNNCFDIHQCSGRTTGATYINKITKLKNDLIFATVYKCIDCNICYLKNSSFRYHVIDVNHECKCQLTICDVCGLQFTSYSSHKHYEIHSKTGKYKIKIFDPITGDYSMIEGINTIADTKKKRSTKRLSTPNKKFKKDLDIPLKVHNTRRSDRRNLDVSKSENDTNDLDDSKNTDFNDDAINDLEDDSVLNASSNDPEMGIEKISKKLKARILVDKYNKNLYRCANCEQHYMKLESLQYHATKFDHSVESELFKCDICDLDFSKYTLPRHKYVHHQRMKLKREDFCIITDRIFPEISQKNTKNDSENLTESPKNSSPKINKITYYKCSDCNVCFLTKLLCYNHTKKHEILDPKMYIQCKICDFQFLIDSLKDHMESHHNIDFKVENLTIEEYKPLGDTLEPKIDSYNAVDKVQSRLVSTTTDVEQN